MKFTSVEFIALGSWNKAIINEPWLRNTCEIAPTEKFTVEVESSLTQIVYKYNVFSIKVSDRMVSVLTNNENEIAGVERISKNILKRLPETPLSAVGVNFDLELETEFVVTDSLFKNKVFGKFSWSRMQATFHANEYSQNLIFDGSTSIVKIRVNFNFVQQQIQLLFDNNIPYSDLYSKAKEVFSI